MKLKLLNTPLGLKPCYDEDFEEKKKLKVGEIYEADIKLVRNIRFHRLFFALINTGYAYLPERAQTGVFGSVEGFRKSVIIAAGFTNTYWNIREKCFAQEAKSISFASMDETEFRDVYDRCKDVIWQLISRYVPQEVFKKNLTNFYL